MQSQSKAVEEETMSGMKQGGANANAAVDSSDDDYHTGTSDEDSTMSETSSQYESDDDDDDDSSYDLEGDDDDDDNESYHKVSAADKHAGLFLSLEMVQMLRTSTSEGNLFSMIPQSTIASMTPKSNTQQQPQRRTSGGNVGMPQSSRMVFALQTKSPMESSPQHKAAEANIAKPKETLHQILKEQHGIEKVQYYPYNQVPTKADYFVKCCVSSHSFELMNAVRQNDLAAIQRQHQVYKKNLQCANKFQESLVHAICRRGLPDMLTYLHGVAGVSLRVCCDGGRTALHDACWTGRPDFACINILLNDSPDLLYVLDKRNFTPLDYIPKEAHEAWNTWLTAHAHLVKPRDF
jgi:hypothetical protein